MKDPAKCDLPEEHRSFRVCRLYQQMGWTLGLAVIGVFLLYTCGPATSEDPVSDTPEAAYITDGNRVYHTADTTDFSLRIDARIKGVVVSVQWSDSLPLPEQLIVFTLLLEQASRDFDLTATRTLRMNFFSRVPELAKEISVLPEVQQHLQETVEQSAPFLDHDYLGGVILQSARLQKMIEPFEVYGLKPSGAYLEKCHARQTLPNNPDILILGCSHLEVSLTQE